MSPTFDVPVVVGRGLDRATGLAATQPQFPIDVRNAYGRDAKMALRPGMAGTGYPPLPWGDDVLMIIPCRASLEVLFVVFERSSRQMRVYRLDPETNTMSALTSPANGLWGTLDPSAEYPVVSGAECNGLVFFAHDEPQITLRLNTIYYTPDPAGLVPGTLTVLTADLNGDGTAAAVFFAGVYAYLVYMFGWGYGNEDDPDRGDIFHFSDPADPVTFSAPNYFLCGVRKDPIVAAVATALQSPVLATGSSVLAFLKADETYRLIGTSPDDFGVEFLDRRYGAVSSRCVVSTGTRAFCWASDGPREVLANGTVPMGQPLELISPLPDDFPALGPERLCFASYDLQRYCVEWSWPNIEAGTVPVAGFLLSLWNPQDPRWTFTTRQVALTCSGELIIRDTGNAPAPPDGYVSSPTGVDNP